MKNIQNKLIILLFTVFAFPYYGSSQDSLTFTPSYGVYVNYPSISITKEKLVEADTINHLNRNYPSSWVKEYISVEILTSNKGKIKKAVGKNDILTKEQKDNMNKADLGTDISVKVQYMPDNELKHNEPQQISFTFTVLPEINAKYPGGEEQLKQYLKDNLMNKISDDDLNQLQLYAVTFIIDEEGLISNLHVVFPWADENIDKLLLKAICNMPKWTPAEYSNGIKVKQEFVLTVGDMKSCVANLINIDPDC